LPPKPRRYKLKTRPGTISVQGINAILAKRRSFILSVGIGNITSTGLNANLLHNRQLSVEVGSIVSNGVAGTLLWKRILSALPSQVSVLSPDNVSLLWNRVLQSSPTVCNITGLPVIMELTVMDLPVVIAYNNSWVLFRTRKAKARAFYLGL
jgi:hypothetical protein